MVRSRFMRRFHARPALDPATASRPRPHVPGDGLAAAAQTPPLDPRLPARHPGHPPPARPRPRDGWLRARRRARSQDVLDLLGMGGPGQPRCLRLIQPAPGDHPPAAAADGADPLRVLPDPRFRPAPDLGPDESTRKDLGDTGDDNTGPRAGAADVAVPHRRVQTMVSRADSFVTSSSVRPTGLLRSARMAC